MLWAWTIEDLCIVLRNNVGLGLQSIADHLLLMTTDVAFDLLQHIGSMSLCNAHLTILCYLGLHIPDEVVQDVRSKYSICNTNHKVVKAKVQQEVVLLIHPPLSMSLWDGPSDWQETIEGLGDQVERCGMHELGEVSYHP